MFTLSTNFYSFLVLILTFLTLTYKYLTKNFDYWSKRNIPGPKPRLFFGNLWGAVTLKHSIGTLLEEIYVNYQAPFIGMFNFGQPALIVRDNETIKRILISDFEYFSDRNICTPIHNSIEHNLLFTMKNPTWGPRRKLLSPILSSAKLKNVFPIIKKVCEDLTSYLKTAEPEQDVNKLCHGASIELLTQTFFGIEAQCLSGENSELKKQVEAMVGYSVRNGVIQAIYFLKPSLAEMFKLNFFPTHVEKFFRKLVWTCVKNRDQLNPNVVINSLLDLRKTNKELDGDVFVAQAVLFYVAGLDAITSTVSFTLYELSKNQNVQDKVRSEIQEIVAEKGLTYDSLMEMNYLDMCLSETLRKYPSLPFLERKCMNDYKIEGTDLVVEKGTPVYIPLLGIQNDERNFPEPNKYIPERFLNNANEEKFIYGPFGGGQRICMGVTYARLMAKMALAEILDKFLVEQSSSTPSYIKIDPKALLLQAKEEIVLKFVQI